MKATHLMLFSIIILVGGTSYLGYTLYETNIELNSTITQLVSTEADLEAANQDIAQKTSEIASLKGEVSGLEQEVSIKQQRIEESETTIGELEEQTAEQKKDIQRLRGVLTNLDKTGNLISETYEETLILYDNSEMFELFRPLWQQVEDDRESYSQLGIAFIYFRDKSKKQEEQIVLGQYNTLFDTIFIYSDASEVRTIYHEIAHTIYKRFFTNENNKEIWEDLYDQLKENNLLSSQYAYTSELEGFAEEYAYYKTGQNPNQSQASIGIMQQIDEGLR